MRTTSKWSCGAKHGRVRFSVRDDGDGFDPRVVRGLGLLGMEERVRRLGGRLAIDSHPGRGTVHPRGAAGRRSWPHKTAKHDAHTHTAG